MPEQQLLRPLPPLPAEVCVCVHVHDKSCGLVLPELPVLFPLSTATVQLNFEKPMDRLFLLLHPLLDRLINVPAVSHFSASSNQIMLIPEDTYLNCQSKPLPFQSSHLIGRTIQCRDRTMSPLWEETGKAMDDAGVKATDPSSRVCCQMFSK